MMIPTNTTDYISVNPKYVVDIKLIKETHGNYTVHIRRTPDYDDVILANLTEENASIVIAQFEDYIKTHNVCKCGH